MGSSPLERGAARSLPCLSCCLGVPTDASGPAKPMQVFDSGSRALLRQFKGHKAPVHVAHFAADQLRVLSGGDDGVVAMWDVTSGQQVSHSLQHLADMPPTGWRLHADHAGVISILAQLAVRCLRCPACSATLTTCAPWSAAQSAQTCGPQAGGWDVPAVQRPMRTWKGLGMMHVGLGGQRILPFCAWLDGCHCRYDHVCKLWDARQRRCLLTVDHGAPIESVAFFPSGGHCVACTAPRHPNAGGAQLSQESAIPCRAGSLLVTAGGTDLCFWQLLQSGQLVQRVTAHQKTITSVVVAALASSQPHVVSAGLDGHVKVSRMRMALTRCRHLQRSRHASPALALCR